MSLAYQQELGKAIFVSSCPTGKQRAVTVITTILSVSTFPGRGQQQGEATVTFFDSFHRKIND